MLKCLSVAGSDCSGGAGIQADLKAFSANETFGMSVITSVVAENTTRVLSVFNVPVEEIQKQIDAVFEDIHVDAVKLGMLPTAKLFQQLRISLMSINQVLSSAIPSWSLQAATLSLRAELFPP